eukprot:CAMPEP_0119259834 /NCGR_PEP_ID=MMETSP1329-20130426/493_1 /TAXON_ID=114041 /ORGANISM="Genus nov. species nov., Strain RCC1024" /LENGTH=114 /DNA_ID=CAMNT_0007259237 /DNA_START=181 /DNA_END=522 /DNA_ORIENTATION=+
MGFSESRLGRMLAPRPEDLPPPTPPSKTFTGRLGQMLAPDDEYSAAADAVATGSAPPSPVRGTVTPDPSDPPRVSVAGAEWAAYASKADALRLLDELAGAMCAAGASDPAAFAA